MMSVELEVLAVWTWAAMKIKGGQHCCPYKKTGGQHAAQNENTQRRGKVSLLLARR